MNSQEMINKLIESPKKEFKATKDKTEYIARTEEDVLYISLHNKDTMHGGPCGIPLNVEWEEIRKPLTFTEVLERVNENTYCKISIEHEEFKHKGGTLKDLLFLFFHLIPNNTAVARLMTEGKFYIEE